jgi:hypothetical protein
MALRHRMLTRQGPLSRAVPVRCEQFAHEAIADQADPVPGEALRAETPHTLVRFRPPSKLKQYPTIHFEVSTEPIHGPAIC